MAEMPQAGFPHWKTWSLSDLGRGQEAAEPAEFLVGDDAIVILIQHADHLPCVACLSWQTSLPEDMDLQYCETAQSYGSCVHNHVCVLLLPEAGVEDGWAVIFSCFPLITEPLQKRKYQDSQQTNGLLPFFYSTAAVGNILDI